MSSNDSNVTKTLCRQDSTDVDPLAASDAASPGKDQRKSPSEQEILQWIRDAIGGDELAAQRFVDHFTPQIKIEIRTRLVGPTIRRVVNTSDISQTVLTDYLIGFRTGRLQLREPRQAIALLQKIVRNETDEAIRFHTRACRDYRMSMGSPDLAAGEPGRSKPSPEKTLEQREELNRYEQHFDPIEWRALQMLADRTPWEAIGRQLNMSPNALRMRIQRSRQRLIARRLRSLQASGDSNAGLRVSEPEHSPTAARPHETLSSAG